MDVLFKFVLFSLWILLTTGTYSFLIYRRSFSESILKSFAVFYFLNLSFPTIFLGVLSLLKPAYFILLTISASFVFVLISVFSLTKRVGNKDIFSAIWNLVLIIKSDFRGRVKEFKREFVKNPIISSLLLILSLFSLIYILIILRASFLFPVRGIDDISYHLPQLVENFLKGKIVQLSIESDPRYAFPKMAHMLSQTYILLTGNLTFVDFMNFWFALFLSISVFLLSKRFLLPFNTGNIFPLISAVSIFLTPIVLGQVGSNYVDLAFASFFISSLTFTSLRNFFVSGLCFGGLIGTKYTAFFLVPFVLSLIRKNGLKEIFSFLLGTTISASFFYIFLFMKTGYFVYPLPWTDVGKRIYPPSLKFSVEGLKEWIHIALAFVKYDNLELSFHKGFGLHFWLISLPLSFVFLIREKFWRKIEFCLLFSALLYFVWNTIPTAHVNARFLVWFVVGTFIFIPYVQSFEKSGYYTALLIFITSVMIINAVLIYPKMKKTEWPIIFNEKKNACKNTISNLLDSGKPLWYPNLEEPASFLEFLGEKYLAETGQKIKISTCNALFYGDRISNLLTCHEQKRPLHSKNSEKYEDDGERNSEEIQEQEQPNFKLSFDIRIGNMQVSKLEDEIPGYIKLFGGEDFAVFVESNFFKKNKSFFNKTLEEYQKCRLR